MVQGELFGGTAEYIALALKGRGYEATYGWYVTALMIVFFVLLALLAAAGIVSTIFNVSDSGARSIPTRYTAIR